MTLSLETERRILFTLIAIFTVIMTTNIALAQDAPDPAHYPTPIVAPPPGDATASDLAWGLGFAVVFLTLVVETIRYSVPSLRRRKTDAGQKIPLPEWAPLLIVGLVLVGGQVLALGGITPPIFPGVVGANVTGLLTSMLAILFNETIWRWTRKLMAMLLEALWKRLFGEASRKGSARLGAVALVLAVSTVALAGLPLPFGSTTKLTLAALTATKCPTTPTVGRDGLVICNKDSASIWWGFGTSASSGSLTNTSTNGNELEAGDCVPIEVGYLTSATNDWTWCYSVAGTAANAVVIRETGVGVR